MYGVCRYHIAGQDFFFPILFQVRRFTFRTLQLNISNIVGHVGPGGSRCTASLIPRPCGTWEFEVNS